MVALSLYKGNLHRAPEAPRRWLMPTPKISLKDFRTLLRRRNRALNRLLTPPNAATDTTNPNPNDVKSDCKSKSEGEVPVLVPVKAEKEEDGKLVDSTDVVVVEPKVEVVENGEKLDVPVNPSGFETSNKEDNNNNKEDATDKQKRKKEIEDKLQILNMKKHGLILNAEEELKRRSMQGMAVRSSLPLQVDTANDTGSMTRLNTPRMGSDGNPIGDMDGEGGDDASNQNMLSRNLLRMSSTSPCSDSQLRKTPYNVGPLSSRSVGVTVSPSRFAPPGQQGQPSNLPPMSLSGTNFVASSPSPVASGGTSVFRDRFSSP
ncbi:mediator of RNA polymerase II transcription subunit 13 isoform X2 [Lycium ferocissimum]|uniref:mediator of RNA polymerase II transcription subunit 13 isoform X2 n=1 Tax=Lycium ferocissimum TaxID=112874 RepID=UPI002816368F|nr:mediator of RNA polymerase II transcription subunit 13 isoform X2 [Lycium ferocissimum]